MIPGTVSVSGPESMSIVLIQRDRNLPIFPFFCYNTMNRKLQPWSKSSSDNSISLNKVV